MDETHLPCIMFLFFGAGGGLLFVGHMIVIFGSVDVGIRARRIEYLSAANGGLAEGLSKPENV